MNINHQNIQHFNSCYIHDSSFSGYSYDYDERRISISLLNAFRGVEQGIKLNNVIFIQFQSCSFWGGGNAVYTAKCHTEHRVLNQLEEIKSENTRHFEGSRLDTVKRYIVFELLLNSGDTMHVVCESIDYEELPVEL